MTRVWTVALLALTFVGIGVYLAAGHGSRPSAEASASWSGSPRDGEEARHAVDGFRVLPPLSETPRTQFRAPTPVLREDRRYQARLHTSAGVIRIELHARRATHTVNNFVFLARHGFYRNVPFHRVLDDFVAQTGDPSGSGTGGPGYAIEDEFHPELRHDAAGVVSMANHGPDTGGSQFFLTLAATPWLDDRHAVFGRVVAGMEVLDQLTRIDPRAPEAVLPVDAPASELAAVGVEPGGTETVGAALAAHLGTAPVEGQSFALAGKRGVVGRVEGGTAVAFYPRPDVLERVEILAAPRAQGAETDVPGAN